MARIVHARSGARSQALRIGLTSDRPPHHRAPIKKGKRTRPDLPVLDYRSSIESHGRILQATRHFVSQSIRTKIGRLLMLSHRSHHGFGDKRFSSKPWIQDPVVRSFVVGQGATQLSRLQVGIGQIKVQLCILNSRIDQLLILLCSS